ncbi:MAG: monofunctional biosynthetic peptidoglycan transglycosylase [Tenuifilaceae bacterium]|jgi:monofunctional biosynthetic peptidoglycan transglycosylase|nr:monofunctional biosynthetic peptidoglycan transglycosylase [Tenuifilaceae bacterium]
MINRWWLKGFRALVLSGIITFFVGVFAYRWVNPNLTHLMLINRFNKETNTKSQSIRKNWVSLKNISPNMVKAAMAAEDAKFTTHWGFDIEAIRKAVKHNKKGRTLKGASTISQQTAKNVFLWPKRSWLRKGLETVFTIAMEALWPKERIMEVYLNIAEFGVETYGVQAASELYYKKDASKLTRAEAALLATVLPRPTKRNPAKPSAYMQRYQQVILRNMNNLPEIPFLPQASKPQKSKKKK